MNTLIKLSPEDREYLISFTKKGTHKSREINRAKVLLDLNNNRSIEYIVNHIEISAKTVGRLYNRFTANGIQGAIIDKPRPGQPRKTDDKDDAFIIATACSESPVGAHHWTLDLLQEEFESKKNKKLGRNTIWLRLKNQEIKPWLKKNVVYT